MDNLSSRFFRIILWVQSLYYFVTGSWALIDVHSFMEITGPKTDIWLVKTVSVLLIAISISLFVNLFIKTNRWPVILLAGSCSIFLAGIDFYYSTKHVISGIYSADGIIQNLLFLSWIWIIIQVKNRL